VQRRVRDNRAGYLQSLAVLRAAKACGVYTKTSIMLGLGETDDEIIDTLVDLRDCGVDIVTFGQYLQPTPRHLDVQVYVTPERFEFWRTYGEEELGFRYARDLLSTIPHVCRNGVHASLPRRYIAMMYSACTTHAAVISSSTAAVTEMLHCDVVPRSPGSLTVLDQRLLTVRRWREHVCLLNWAVHGTISGLSGQFVGDES
jgi:hypothetical protein